MVEMLASAPRGGGNPSAAANAFGLLVLFLTIIFFLYIAIFYIAKEILYRKMLSNLILAKLNEFDENEEFSFQEIVDKFSREKTSSVDSILYEKSLSYLVTKGYIVESQRHLGFETYEEVFHLTDTGREKARSISD